MARGSGKPVRLRGRRTPAVIALVVVLAVALALAVGACGSSKSTGGSVTVAGVKISEDKTLHDMLPDSIKSSGVVRVASDVPYPPYEMFVSGTTDQFTGIDPDLGKAIAAVLGVKFQFQVTIFDSIIPAIQAGKADIVMSAMYDNPTRQKKIDFVDYGQGGSGLLVAAGNPNKILGLQSLPGKKVAVESGTTQADLLLNTIQPEFVARGLAKMTILQYPKDTDAQLAVLAGNAVADMTDGPGGAYIAKTNPKFEVVADSAYPHGYDAATFAIGVSKNLPELRDAIQKALQKLVADGTYKKILDAYGASVIGIPTITINAGK